MNLFLRSLILTALFVGMPAHGQSLANERLDRVVAVVDEEVILQSDLDRAMNNILGQYAGRTEQLPPRDVLERQVLDRIILIKVQAQRARDTGLRVSEPEIDAAISNVAQQNGMTIDQLRASLERDGFAYGEFRETMREELLLQRMQQRFAQTRVSVSDIEIDNLLARGGDMGSEVRLGHILVSVPDGADAEAFRVAGEKAAGVRQLIADGMDFSAAAIRYSNAPNALEGGELGWRGVDQIPTAFVELIANLGDGEVSPPTRGPAGYHILKVYERRSQGAMMVEEFNARHIMIRIDELTSDAEAQEEVRQLRERIVAGEDFAEVARAHSKDFNTAPLGGDMGWFPAEGYGSAVASTVRGLQDGQLSEPFRTDVGWHILERLGSREQDRTETYQRTQAAETIRMRKAEEEYDRYLRQLRDEAFIENRLASSG